MSESKTTVVHCGRNLYDYYGGRNGRLGNRHRVGECFVCKCHHSRKEAIALFETEFNAKLTGTDSEDFKDFLLSLHGMKLGCYCHPLPCHLDVVAKYLNSLEGEGPCAVPA